MCDILRLRIGPSLLHIMQGLILKEQQLQRKLYFIHIRTSGICRPHFQIPPGKLCIYCFRTQIVLEHVQDYQHIRLVPLAFNSHPETAERLPSPRIRPPYPPFDCVVLKTSNFMNLDIYFVIYLYILIKKPHRNIFGAQLYHQLHCVKYIKFL